MHLTALEFFFNFIIKRLNGGHEVLEVTWELEEHNLEREMKGLIRTCNMLNLNTGNIITFDQEESYTQENVIIDAIPFWKWILFRFTKFHSKRLNEVANR